MPKIPPTLCAMPWNVKKTIIDSLEFRPRIRLGQCSTEFQTLIDSFKIEFDRVSLNFHSPEKQKNSIEIRIEKHGKIESNVELIDYVEMMHRRKSADPEKFVYGDGDFIAAAVSILLRKINKPNVSIDRLEVNFVKRKPGESKKEWIEMNRKLIGKMTNVLILIRQFDPNLNKIKAKQLGLFFNGSPLFTRTFLAFFEKKTLGKTDLEQYPWSNSLTIHMSDKAETELVVTDVLERESASVDVVFVSWGYMLETTRFMMRSAHCKHYIINYTSSEDGHINLFFSEFPICPENENCRILKRSDSKDYVSVEILEKKITMKRISLETMDDELEKKNLEVSEAKKEEEVVREELKTRIGELEKEVQARKQTEKALTEEINVLTTTLSQTVLKLTNSEKESAKIQELEQKLREIEVEKEEKVEMMKVQLQQAAQNSSSAEQVSDGLRKELEKLKDRIQKVEEKKKTTSNIVYASGTVTLNFNF